MCEERKTMALKNTFKPLTESMNKLLKLSTENSSKIFIPMKEKIDLYREPFKIKTGGKVYIKEDR